MTIAPKADVFISFKTQETGVVAEQVANALKLQNYHTYYCHDTIEIGNKFPERIFASIDSAKCYIVFLSPTYFSGVSNWCEQEFIHICLQNKIDKGEILPVYMCGTNPNDMKGKVDGRITNASTVLSKAHFNGFNLIHSVIGAKVTVDQLIDTVTKRVSELIPIRHFHPDDLTQSMMNANAVMKLRQLAYNITKSNITVTLEKVQFYRDYMNDLEKYSDRFLMCYEIQKVLAEAINFIRYDNCFTSNDAWIVCYTLQNILPPKMYERKIQALNKDEGELVTGIFEVAFGISYDFLKYTDQHDRINSALHGINVMKIILQKLTENDERKKFLTERLSGIYCPEERPDIRNYISAIVAAKSDQDYQAVKIISLSL